MVQTSFKFKTQCSFNFKNNLETLLSRHNIAYSLTYTYPYTTEIDGKKTEYGSCIYRCIISCKNLYELNEEFEKFIEDCNSEPYFISISAN